MTTPVTTTPITTTPITTIFSKRPVSLPANHEWIIGTAGIIGLTSFSTLLFHVYKTHNTSSLPWTWILMNMTAQCFSITYAIIKGAYGMYIPGFIFISGLFFLLYMKVRYKSLPVDNTNNNTNNNK